MKRITNMLRVGAAIHSLISQVFGSVTSHAPTTPIDPLDNTQDITDMSDHGKMSEQPYYHRSVFLQPRQLTTQQILARLEVQEQRGTRLPWGLRASPLIYSLFSPVRDQLWLSTEEDKALFNEIRTLWLKNGGSKPLLSALSRHPHSEKPIKKAVLLGLSNVCGKTWDYPEYTYYYDDTTWYHWRQDVLRRMLLVVIFVCATEYLSEQSGHPIKMFAQDPTFEASDEEFLKALSIDILRMPEAEAITDHETFVFAPWIVKFHTANSLSRCIKHQPAIYIGHGIQTTFNCLNWCPGSHGDGSTAEEEIERMLVYQKERSFFSLYPDLPKNFSRLEELLHKLSVHIRTSVPTEDEIKMPCTSSYGSVPATECC